VTFKKGEDSTKKGKRDGKRRRFQGAGTVIYKRCVGLRWAKVYCPQGEGTPELEILVKGRC